MPASPTVLSLYVWFLKKKVYSGTPGLLKCSHKRSYCSFHCEISILHLLFRLTDIKVQLEQFEKWFLNINPDAAVPVMMYKGKPYLESRDIAQFAIRNISTQHKLLISDDVIVSQYMKMYDGFSNLF